MYDDRYHELYTNAPFPILSIDATGQIVACNTALSVLLGRGRGELIGTPVLKWIATADRDRSRESMMHAIEGLATDWSAVLRCGDGAQRTVGIRAVPQPGAEAKTIDVFISERGAERPIRAADVAVLELVTNMPGVYALVLDSDLRVRHARGMSRTHWLREEDVIGRELATLLAPSDANAQQLETMQREVAHDAVWSGMLRHVRADQSEFPAHVYARLRVNPRTREATGIVLAGREANDEMTLRGELAQAQRLAPIGAVATAVARELSAGIIAARAVLDLDVPRLEEARSGLSHLQQMTQTLLTFATDVPLERAVTPVAPLVADVLGEFAEDIAVHGIQVHDRIPVDVPDLAVDARHMREVLRQILRNAVDAVAERARPGITIDAAGDGRTVVLRVQDNGAGIPESVIGRAFEPFFTTKVHRLGLGLAIARGLVAAHGGRILVSSQERGTTVTIELPDTPTSTSHAPAFRAAPLVLGNERTVLLVDDDAAVRKLFRRVLEKVGYRTTEAWSGRSALAELTNGAPPDFLVTDLRMAGGNGYWLLQEIRRDYPDLLRRTIIVTGEQAETQVDRISSETGCPVLRKPIDIRVLLEVLDTLAMSSAAG